jgi:cytochrome c553
VFVRARRPPRPVPTVTRKGRPPAKESTAEVRHCPRHGNIEFHYVGRGAGPKQWRCKRCVGEAVTRRKQKIRRILVDEAGGRCIRCGYDRCILNLVFHHVDPTTKRLSMSMDNGRSLAVFREEAMKCVLLCANCHGEVEDLERRRALPNLKPRRTYPGTRPIELRSCRFHGVTEFALYGKKMPKWTCKKCNVAANLKRRRYVRRELIMLGGGCCATCGYNRSAAALQFHHVDPSTKLFDLRPGCLRARALVRAELAKCVLVCANCHGEIEAGLIECPPPRARFGEWGTAGAERRAA